MYGGSGGASRSGDDAPPAVIRLGRATGRPRARRGARERTHNPLHHTNPLMREAPRRPAAAHSAAHLPSDARELRAPSCSTRLRSSLCEQRQGRETLPASSTNDMGSGCVLLLRRDTRRRRRSRRSAASARPVGPFSATRLSSSGLRNGAHASFFYHLGFRLPLITATIVGLMRRLGLCASASTTTASADVHATLASWARVWNSNLQTNTAIQMDLDECFSSANSSRRARPRCSGTPLPRLFPIIKADYQKRCRGRSRIFSKGRRLFKGVGDRGGGCAR